jgi:hypothetical protein
MSADLVFTQIASQSTTPPSGTASIYAKTDGKFYTMDDAGTETSQRLWGRSINPSR